MSSGPAATFYKILTSAFCNLLDAHAVPQRTGGIALERSTSHEPNSDFLVLITLHRQKIAPEWQNYQRSTWLQKHPIFVNLEVRRNVLNITRVFSQNQHCFALPYTVKWFILQLWVDDVSVMQFTCRWWWQPSPQSKVTFACQDQRVLTRRSL